MSQENLDDTVSFEKESAADVEVLFNKTLLSFLVHEPFFADIIRMLRKEQTYMIPTAGVGFDGTSIVLYYNPRFLSKLTKRQIFGLLKHECYHIIFRHITSRKQEPHLLWNIATDLAINSTIPLVELPAGGLIPGRPFESLYDEDGKDIIDNDKSRSKLSSFIASLPPNKTSEWYMEKIVSNDEVSDLINEMYSNSGQGHGSGQCNHGTGGESGDEISEDSAGDSGEGGGSGDGDASSCPICKGQGSGKPMPGEQGSGTGIGFDHHFDMSEMSDGDKEYVESKLKDIVSKAVKRANEQRSWGTVPASMQSQVRAMVSKTVSWKDVLRYFCGTKQRANKSRSFKKINRKYPYQHPGRKIGRTSHIAIYIDQSGSVSDDELQLFFSSLNELAKKTTFTVFHFDCSVDEESKMVWNKNKKIKKAYRTRGGGTDFNAVEMFHRKVIGQFDGYLVLTDGCAPKPLTCKTKRCWVLLPGTQLQFNPHKNDVVVKMDKNK